MPTTTKPTIVQGLTSYELEREYLRRRSGKPAHWFDASSKRFFGTRMGAIIEMSDGTVYFTTSEQPPHGERMHSLRRMDASGDISTVGEFCAMSYAQARKALHNATH